MKATNLLKLYMHCNFSRSITETSTHAWPWLILHGPWTRHYCLFCFVFFFVLFLCVCLFFFFFFCFFVFCFFLSFKTMLSQNIRYTSFMPASENDHSNFHIYSFSLPTGTFWSKEGSTKVNFSCFIANYIQFKVTFPWPAEFNLNSYSFVVTKH